MKKILSLLLAVIMLFAFTACGSTTDNEDVRGDITSNDSSTDSSSNDASSDEVEFSIGDTEGNIYKSNFIGVECVLDDNWTFYSDSQIAELNNITADALGDDYAEKMKAANIVYDMFATDASGNNIYVILEKVNALSATFNDVESFVDNSMSAVEDSLTQTGAVVNNIKKAEVTFAGEKTYAICIESTLNGVSLFQKQVFLKRGAYVVLITITSISTDTTDSIISTFHPLNPAA